MKTVPIRTPYNARPVRSTVDTRRVLRNGRWVRPDSQAAAVLSWLRSPEALQAVRGDLSATKGIA